MSLSFSRNVQPVCVRDPRTIVSDKSSYAVLKAGSQTTWKQYTTTSISTSSLQFTCPPPNGGIFVDRKVMLYVPVRLTFTGIPANGQRLLLPGLDAPRAFPLHSSIETLTATINNQAVSINASDVIQPLANWFNTGSEIKNSDYSPTPCYPDQSTNYNDLVGTNRNPLGNYNNVCDNVPAPRGGFPFVIVQNDPGDGVNPQTAIVDVAFCEALFLSPFWWGKGVSNEAFYNVTTMDFTITFLSSAANRMWSHSFGTNGGVAITTSAYTFGGLAGGPTSFPNAPVPSLLFTYITPQETQILSPNVPISYPYFDVQRYQTLQSSVNSGASATMQSQNLQLSSIPRRVYIFVRQQNNVLYQSPSNTDTYFAINNLSIQFMNKNGLLASASPLQLYAMSVKNGCTMSWTQWSGYSPSDGGGSFGAPGSAGTGTVGSIVCLEFASDIGLDSLDAPGKLAQATLQVQVNATNTSAAAIAPEMYIVVVSEGVFTIEGYNRCSTNVGVITSKDILDCQHKPGVDYRAVMEVNGGDFFSGVKEGLSKLATKENLGKALSMINSGLRATHGLSTVASLTPLAPAAPLLRAIGYGEGEGGRMHHRVRFGHGEGEGEGEGGVLAGRMRRHRRMGHGDGVLVPAGGEGLSRADLARRILY